MSSAGFWAGAAPADPAVGRTLRGGVTREVFEKARLAGRTGGYQRADPANDAGSPFAVAATSALYCAPAQRFLQGRDSSFSSVETALRAEQAAREARRHAVVQGRREREDAREAARWQAAAEAVEADAARVALYRAQGTKARRCAGSVPFDLVTHAYADTPAAQRLRAQDDAARARAARRTAMLAAQQNKHGFDPITGAPVAGK